MIVCVDCYLDVPRPPAPGCDSCGHPGCGGGTDCALRTGRRIMRLAERVRRAA